ncbi:NrdG Organic radical activating enzymes [uncultured Caudovirales phage]|uniref:NrdG Organic radical activating enzymes n=1 Tax=uncultured Caudovirales phage TaxID=2100421 RepID=A0A6J5KVB2_9CAUD|nr:NrdG Organic radical activating enzymes [uncultured Caudovirales phage]CAB5209048.1 NrdG Organic radical activating enzymes [uncultured Caudovirales phage]
MSKIKIAELFYSIQGEGRYMGVPSVFLRTFGCNFKCAGFGMTNGQLSKQVEAIAKQHELTPFTKYEDLPLVSTGCDSYASWDPRFKDLSPMLTSDAIVDRIMEILPYHKWEDEHLVITGGEPLLGWQRAYEDLLDHPTMSELKEITFETNGTQKLNADFKSYLLFDWLAKPFGRREVTFSVSAKLSCSGEHPDEAINPEVVCEYEEVGYTYLKFVVATEADAEEALEATDIYRAAGFKGPVYLMPVGGVESVYTMNNRNVAEYAMKNGLRYSDRLQVPLFKNEWGT